MNQRFQIGWMRLIPFIGYHHVLMMLLAFSIVLSSILLAGCTSTSLSNVYLLSLSYTHTPSSPSTDTALINPNISSIFSEIVHSTAANITTPPVTLEVRVGYLGLCMKESSGLWACSKSATTLANVLRNPRSDDTDPLNMIWIAKKFKDEVVFAGLIFTSILLALGCFLCLYTFPGWHEEQDGSGSEREVKPFPSRIVSQIVSQIALAFATVASLLSFVSAFWQHISCSAGVTLSEALSYGTIKGSISTVGIFLGWSAVFLQVVTAVGLLVMILSIRILSELFS